MVVVIIGLLTALLLPGLQRARELARQVACRSNLRQNGLALAGYAGDYSDRFPVMSDWGTMGLYTSQNGIVVAGVPYSTGLLAWGNYGTRPETLYCPNRNEGRPSYGDRRDPDVGLAHLFTGPECASSYLHRADNDLPGALGANARVTDGGVRAWLADCGFFFRVHPTLEARFSRYSNHDAGYNALYTDGGAIFVADTGHAYWSNVDGGGQAWPAIDQAR